MKIENLNIAKEKIMSLQGHIYDLEQWQVATDFSQSWMSLFNEEWQGKIKQVRVTGEVFSEVQRLQIQILTDKIAELKNELELL